nr:hypothetical protein [Meloidogyne graminicola]
MKITGFFFIFMFVLFFSMVSTRFSEDNFENDFGISDSNIERKSLNRIRRGIFCNSACSCGWGNCYPSTGYTASNCCSPGYV